MEKNITQNESDNTGRNDSHGKKIIAGSSPSTVAKPPAKSAIQPEKKTTTLHVTFKGGKKESPVVLDDNAANAPTAK